MNREQTLAWGKNLKPDDKLIVRSYGFVCIGTVKKVTPSGWVVTKEHGTYAVGSWRDWYSERGGSREIIPYTEEMAALAIRQEEEREKSRMINKTIREARNIAYDWAHGNRHIDYELALKILEIANKTEE